MGGLLCGLLVLSFVDAWGGTVVVVFGVAVVDGYFSIAMRAFVSRTISSMSA